MENVDEIILHQLRSIGIEIDEGVQSLRDLSTDGVFRSISACLRAITGQSDVPRNLPPSMSLRYSACGKLAEMIKGLGYRGDIGYQTILYCSETDMRNVLAFLIERLPREHAEIQQSGKISYQDAVLKSICSELASQLNRPWIPPRYRVLTEENSQSEVETVSLLEAILFSNKNQQKSIVSQAGNRPQVLTASLVDALALAKAMESRTSASPARFATPMGDAEHFKEEIKGAVQAAALMAKIAGKTSGKAPKPLPRKPKAGGNEPEKHVPSPEDEERARKEKADQLRTELQRLKEELNQVLIEVTNLGRRRGELERETEELKAEIERSQGEIANRELVTSLLPNAAENIEKLQGAINQRRAKIDQLRQQWLEMKASLEGQLDKLSGAAELDERKGLEKRLEDAERDRESIIGEIALKEESIKILEAELEKAPKDVTRSVYTKRIIDMIGNTKKQKTEIQKIAADTRVIQKEMNSLNEKVDRAFHIADEMVFRDSKRDESARKMYRLIAAMHLDFAATVEAVDDAGALNRELDDTETQVDAEMRKGWQERAQKIAADLQAMRQEQAPTST